MHRLLSGAVAGQSVDHKDRNSLNNQRENLRIANESQNGANTGLRANSTSGLKGVCWDKWTSRWMVSVGHKYIGRFDTPEEAARAYDVKAKEMFGEFASTNEKLGLLPKREEPNDNS